MSGDSLTTEQPSGTCLTCSTKTCFVCHRCGDFYCSRKCQLTDWQRHRYICFPIPPLVQPTACSAIAAINAEDLQNAQINKAHPPIIKSISSDRDVATPMQIAIPDQTLNKSPATNECDKKNNQATNKLTQIAVSQTNVDLTRTSPPAANIESGSIVYITSFTSANRCFIREASESAEKAYLAVCNKVNSLWKELPRKTKIKYLEYGIGKFNGRFHRVKSIDPKNSSRLSLLDEGITKILKLVDMREISSELLMLPCCSMQVQLADAPHMGYDLSFFKPFEGKLFIATFMPNGHVELRQKDAPKSLNTQILDFFGRANTLNNQSNLTKKVPETVKQEGIAAQLQSTSRQNILDFNQKQAAVVSEMDTKNSPPKVMEENSTITQADAKHELSNETQPQLKETTSLSMPTADELPKPSGPTQKLDGELNDKDHQILDEIVQLPIETLTPPPLKSSDSANVSPLLCSPFEMQRLFNKSRDGFDVCIVENSNVSRGIIAAFDKLSIGEIYQMRSHLAKFMDPQPYRPVLKEYVIVLSEANEWCRAKIMEIKGNLYSVLYIDIANVATVPENRIRRYPPNGFSSPCYTSVCLIDGFPHKPTERQIEFLNQNLKLNSTLHIDSVSYLQDMALIKCKTLIDKLNSL